MSDFESPNVKTTEKRRRISLRGILYFVFLVSLAFLVVVPIVKVLSDVPAEIALWHEAAAFEDKLDGKFAAAAAHLDDAISWDPDNSDFYLRRASYRDASGDEKGRDEDREKYLELTADVLSLADQRSDVLQALGKHDESIKQLEVLEKESREWNPLGRAMVLNHLAYRRAIAGRDLEQALDEVNRAIELDMQFKQKQEDDRHRGLSGLLGYLFGAKKRQIVEESSYLDTRGYIYYLLGDAKKARADLDRAVPMVEAHFTAFYGQSELARHQLMDHTGQFMVDLRELNSRKISMAYHVAVIRYHRALILDALNETESAKRDYFRILELKFVPGPDLY